MCVHIYGLLLSYRSTERYAICVALHDFVLAPFGRAIASDREGDRLTAAVYRGNITENPFRFEYYEYCVLNLLL